VELKEAGVSTLGARKVWYDDTVRRLNGDERGRFLGDFKAEDKILMLLDDGSYAFSSFDLSTHFDDKMIHLEKFDEDRPVSAVYHEGEKDEWYVKRFLPEFSKNPTGFIGEHKQSKLWVASTLHHPHVRIRYNRRFKHTRDREDDVLDLRGFISLKGVRALGNKLSALPVTEVTLEPPVKELEAALEQELETRSSLRQMRLRPRPGHCLPLPSLPQIQTWTQVGRHRCSDGQCMNLGKRAWCSLYTKSRMCYLFFPN
jgi:topoisomerase-4 subunit A